MSSVLFHLLQDFGDVRFVLVALEVDEEVVSSVRAATGATRCASSSRHQSRRLEQTEQRARMIFARGKYDRCEIATGRLGRLLR